MRGEQEGFVSWTILYGHEAGMADAARTRRNKRAPLPITAPLPVASSRLSKKGEIRKKIIIVKTRDET
jgi:hypothetical protein